MRTKLIVLCAVLLSALFCLRSIPPLYASDFDKFAMDLIRDIGVPGKRVVVTDPIQGYIDDNDVDDRIDFLTENMTTKRVIDSRDPELNRSQIGILKAAKVENVSRVITLSSPYFKRFFSNYNLVIRFWESANGDVVMEAAIFHNNKINF